MTTPVTTTVLDTREMPTVHTFFRRELRLAGAAVRRVPVGDVHRAGVVADVDDATVADRHRARPAPRRVDRVDRSAGEDEVGRGFGGRSSGERESRQRDGATQPSPERRVRSS